MSTDGVSSTEQSEDEDEKIFDRDVSEMQDLLRIAEAGIYSSDTLLRMIQEKLKTSNMIERVNSYDERKKQLLQSILSSLINYT